MPVLTLQNGERAGAAFPFDRPVVLGRGRRADIVVDDPSASRRHAQIELHGREWQLNDLESANGTHLNGRPISRPTTIRPGDLIGIGGLTFRYEPDAKKDTPDTVFFVEEDSPASQIILSKPVEVDPPAPTDPRQAQVLVRLAEILGDRLPGRRGPRLRARRAAQGGAARRPRPGAASTRSTAGSWCRQHPRPGGAPAKVGYSRTLMKQALARREGLVIVDAGTEGKASGSDSLLMMGLRSVLCVPITFRNEVFGVLQLDGHAGAAPFTESRARNRARLRRADRHVDRLRAAARAGAEARAARSRPDAGAPRAAGLPAAAPARDRGLRLRGRVHAGAGGRRRLLRLHPALADRTSQSIAGDVSGKGDLGGDLRRPRHQRLPLPVGGADLAVDDPRARQQVAHARVARRHVRDRGRRRDRHGRTARSRLRPPGIPLGVLRAGERLVAPGRGDRRPADRHPRSRHVPADVAPARAGRHHHLLQRRRHRGGQRRRRSVRQRAAARRDPAGRAAPCAS